MENRTWTNSRMALCAGALAAGFFFMAYFAVSLSTYLAGYEATTVEEFVSLEMRNGVVFSLLCSLGLFGATYGALHWGRRQGDRLAALDEQLSDAGHRLAAVSMVHTVIHDTNNLLGVVRSGLAMLKEPELAASRDALCDRMKTAVDRIEELHRQLLQRERDLHAGQSAKSEFAVVEVFDELRSYARLHPRLKQCRLEFEACDASLRLVANRTELSQALLNLVLNAADATDNRGRILAAAILQGHRLQIRVDDNGPGVAPEDRERIFGAFVTGKKHGMGLGLMSVRGFCERHDGVVSIDASKWGGARFVLDLPAAGPRGGTTGSPFADLGEDLPAGSAHGSREVAPPRVVSAL
ncbi:MAG: sensor histidine kinase [Verrucomicrobiota bacterium]